MPPSSVETRKKLIDAATRSFAENGVFVASLVDITRKAGQRNRGAIYFHFGSRHGLLAEVLGAHADFLAEREGALLDLARGRPTDDVAGVVEAIVRPAVELAETGWRGRCYLVILAELVNLDPAEYDPAVQAALDRTGGYEVYRVLEERMPPMDADLRAERLSLVTSFILRAVADRARSRGRAGRPQLDLELFTRNLIGMVTARVTAPVSRPSPSAAGR
ncbi:MAG: TetR family transcriptional regulator [Acidimicrobiales bacterium]